MSEVLDTTVEKNTDYLRTHIAWRTPHDEFAGIARIVARLRKQDNEMPPGDVFLAVPNKVWLKQMRVTLEPYRISAVSAKNIIAGVRETDLAIDFAGGVTIGSYGQIAACKPRHLFALGLVEGFFPVAGATDEAAVQAQRRALLSAVSNTPETIVLSSFKRITPDEATKLHLPFTRLRREHGEQLAVLAPSRFIGEMGSFAPSSVSGEQFLANYFS
jgi:hypothetical protein